MGEEIGFVISRTSTIRTDMCWLSVNFVGAEIIPSLRANGSGKCPPDDRLREAIQNYKARLDCFVANAPRNDELSRLRLGLVAKIRLDRAVHLDGQRVAITIFRVARGNADPALAHAIFFDIGFLDALESDADVARQNIGVVIRALRIGRETVWQSIGHRFIL